MSKEKQLVKNTFIVAIGKICTQFLSFFLLPLYTALLSPDELGIVDLLNTYVMILIPMLFFQIDQAIFRFLIDCRKDEKEKSIIISTTIITVLFQVLIFIILYVFASYFINNKYKLFIISNVIALMMSNLLLQVCRGLGDNNSYSIGTLISGASALVLNVLFIVVFNMGAYGLLLATFISNILCTMYIFFKKKIYLYIKIKNYSKNIRKSLWKYSIPMIPNQLSWWIINVSDRNIIAYALGIGFNGIYSAANKFSSIVVSIFSIFNLTWSESAAMYIDDEERNTYFSNVINKATKFSVALCFGVISLMPFVFKFLITGEEYSSAYYQIPILMLSTIFSISVSLFGALYVGLKKTNEIAKTSIYAAIINIVINILLINKIGLYAASISTLVSYICMTVYRYVDIQKYIKIKIDLKFLFVSILISCVLLFTYYLNVWYLSIISLLITICFSIMFNIDLIKNLFLTIKKLFKKILTN